MSKRKNIPPPPGFEPQVTYCIHLSSDSCVSNCSNPSVPSRWMDQLENKITSSTVLAKTVRNAASGWVPLQNGGNLGSHEIYIMQSLTTLKKADHL